MNRRWFLKSIAAVVGGELAERALWVPGRKMISVPAPQVANRGYVQEVRYVTSWLDGTPINRMDILYGFGTVFPEVANFSQMMEAERRRDYKFLDGSVWPLVERG